ncbi:MAG TPA: NUDIX hydrolase [Candidatus Nanoarchaeia archaeon]|nr:NUDIX hydrolase [Candidatus Nanoarchaeia archaeon]
MSEKPKVGVGIFLIKDNKILLLKRKGAHGEGSWCTPGGHLEFKESLEECSKREVLEETGIKIETAEFLTVTNDIFEGENKHYLSVFMKAEIKDQEPQNIEPDRHVALEWFSWDNLPENLFLPLQNLLNSGFNLFKN